MLSKMILPVFALALSFAAAAVETAGYVGNGMSDLLPCGKTVDANQRWAACNGEEIFAVNPTKVNTCYDVSNYRASTSIAATGFGKNQRLNFFFNSDCTDQVAHTTSDECYIHNNVGVKSFKLVKT